MTINELVEKPGIWLDASGPESDLILSSRVRLARNLSSFPFPHKASPKERREVLEQVRFCGERSISLGGGSFFDIKELSKDDRIFLLERHLISHEMALQEMESGLLVSESEMLSVMINEEDHLRLQAILSGFQLKESYQNADRLDDEMESSVEYAYHEEWGYLTSCPTNVGSGLRASVLVHLPGLVLTRRIDSVLRELSQVGLSVRGLYGEGTNVMGGFFQVSNQATLGRPEEEIVDGLESATKQILEREKDARGILFQNARWEMEDKIWRAYGILKFARQVSSEEAMNLLSAVRLGVSVGIISGVNMKTINALVVFIQPSHLQHLVGRELQTGERDFERANFIRKKLNKN